MSEFADQLHEVFEKFGRVQMRRMFGGHGVFHDGRMLGLVTSGRLYLKTDEHTRSQFVAKKLPPFEYMRGSKLTPTSYYEAPPEIFEDRDEAAMWARLAWEAVLRTPAPKAKAKAKPLTKPPAKKTKSAKR